MPRTMTADEMALRIMLDSTITPAQLAALAQHQPSPVDFDLLW